MWCSQATYGLLATTRDYSAMTAYTRWRLLLSLLFILLSVRRTTSLLAILLSRECTSLISSPKDAHRWTCCWEQPTRCLLGWNMDSRSSLGFSVRTSVINFPAILLTESSGRCRTETC